VPTGELVIALLLALGAGLLVIAWWAARKARVNEADRDHLLDLLEKVEAARAAWEARYLRLRTTDQEVREKFLALRGAYLALKDRLKTQPAADPAVPARTTVEILTAELDRFRQQVEDLTLELDQARQKLDEAEGRFADLARFDGRLWLRPPAGDVPPFRPRAERGSVIISVLNLKGGVGKTTLTANLAATLATPNRPALMVDLDYQRSLSMLLIGDRRRKELHRHGCSLQHFLGRTAHRVADLTDRLEDLAPDLPGCSVLPNSDSPAGSDAADSLEETENRLMAEWLFDRSKPDPRFFLRAALHDPALGFDWVLLDCPPRLTTACVSALAASDFVLIPVVPDPVSTRAVENLLRTLARFRAALLPDLAVVGIVPNMVRHYSGEMVRAQVDALGELKTMLPALWDPPVPILDAGIKQSAAFGEAAAETDAVGRPRLAVTDPDVREAFRALAEELEGEIGRASRRAATVPAKPGARARSGR
jgi:cellulose biosynthesis protein BcsQ